MSRWPLLFCCVSVLAGLIYSEPIRSPNAVGLGGACSTDRDCQVGLDCGYVPGVLEAQCTASCNTAAACQDRFGRESMCLGADLCTRTCQHDTDCPDVTGCNAYGWCERP